MKKSYKKTKEEIDNIFSYENSEVFEFEFSPNKEIYAKYFKFCSTYSNNNYKKLKLQPIYFYFRRYDELNAAAFKENGINFITISKYLFHTLIDRINNSDNIFQSEELVQKYSEFEKIIPLKLEQLLFQSTMLFIFYHEFGHLIQGSELSEFHFNENEKDINNNYDLKSHLLEYDADLNGAQYVCFHTIEYLEELYKENNLSPESIHKLMAVSLSGIMIYRLMFLYNGMDKIPQENPIKFYLKDKTHPHPIVRIAYVIQHYAQIFEANTNIKVDENYLYNLTIKISDSFFDTTNYVEFINNYDNNKQGIDNYINELYDLAELDKTLVRHKHHLE
jgi:hypothetical protein